jgi:hypothetical protein
MLAAGREHCDDISALSGEGAVEEMVGMRFPSPSALKQFLYRFHDEITDVEVEARRTGHHSPHLPTQDSGVFTRVVVATTSALSRCDPFTTPMICPVNPDHTPSTPLLSVSNTQHARS